MTTLRMNLLTLLVASVDNRFTTAQQDYFASLMEAELVKHEPPQCECGGGCVERAGFCRECLAWEDYGHCVVCGQLSFKDGKCEECQHGGFCETCGYDKARGTHEVQIAVDRFVCKDEFGHKISRG